MPVVPLVSSTTSAGWPGTRRDLAGVAGDQLLEGVAGDLFIGPRQHAPQAGLDRLDQALVLGVVDQQRNALALAHVPELRPGEVGVQVQHPRAQPAGSERHVDQPAMVAAQDPDRVALAYSASAKSGRERYRAVPELGERQRPRARRSARAGRRIGPRGSRSRRPIWPRRSIARRIAAVRAGAPA